MLDDGHVDDFTAWLRQRIQARLALARGTIEPGNNWHSTWAMGDSAITRLMEANDPRDTIARCEAELAILEEHASEGDGRWPECVRCADTHPARCECGRLAGEHWRGAYSYPCATVRLLGSAYKHQPGYREEWAATSPLAL